MSAPGNFLNINFLRDSHFKLLSNNSELLIPIGGLHPLQINQQFPFTTASTWEFNSLQRASATISIYLLSAPS